MARPYTINITDGEGSERVLSGNYTVESLVNGYDNTTINPASIVIDKNTAIYNFTIASTGTFTIHVSEDGTSGGINVVGATFIRCDEAGNEYGNLVTSNELGLAYFDNVPYALENSPIIYFKQKSSDGNHEFDDTLKNITGTSSTILLEVENSLPILKTINLTDSNYSGLKVSEGQITLS